MYALRLLFAVVVSLALALPVFAQKKTGPSAAVVAKCEQVRKNRAEGAEAQGLNNATAVAAGAAGGLLGAVVGAAISAGVNEAAGQTAYEQCVARNGDVAMPAPALGQGAGPSKGNASPSAKAGTTASPRGSGTPVTPLVRGSCPHLPPTCSGARSHCNKWCAEKNLGGRCSNECVSSFSLCMDSGTWSTQACNRTGMAQR